jgi:general secretion pathway protein H
MLELLVVLTILGLLLATVPTGLTASLPGLRLRAAAAGVADALREARRAAMAEGHERQIRFDPTGSAYRLVPEGTATALPAGTSLRLVGVREGQIGFFADGGSTGGAIELTLGSGHRTVKVDWLTGRVRSDE